MKKPKIDHFTVTSGYGANTKQPFVTLDGPKLPVQIESAAARALALSILEGSIAAEADGLVVEFFRSELDMEMEQVAALLRRFRDYRRRWRNEVDAA
ncbi:MAG: hypothetical protein HC828_12375 [Blastochloris sp.]|nr:hypothetical protein [Blastochloris sp.]